MEKLFSAAETAKTERRNYYYMAPAFAIELNPENGAAPEDAAWYAAPAGDDGFAQNTTARD